MSFPSRIYLTGFMASGKSTVAPILAEMLEYRCIDMDAVIEEDAGRPIPAIFDDEGEDGFRRRERIVLTRLTEQDRVVIATGGGALVTDEALAIATSTGAVVYLEASAETILTRLAGTGGTRPLLQGEDAGETRVRSLLARRRPFYERADIRIDVEEADPHDIARRIMHRLAASGGSSGDDDASGRDASAPRNVRPSDSRRS